MEKRVSPAEQLSQVIRSAVTAMEQLAYNGLDVNGRRNRGPSIGYGMDVTTFVGAGREGSEMLLPGWHELIKEPAQERIEVIHHRALGDELEEDFRAVFSPDVPHRKIARSIGKTVEGTNHMAVVRRQLDLPMSEELVRYARAPHLHPSGLLAALALSRSEAESLEAQAAEIREHHSPIYVPVDERRVF